jgi:hypothetical protein
MIAILLMFVFISVNKNQVSQIDKNPRPLPQTENNVFDVDGVNKQADAAGQTEIPKIYRYHAFLLFFRSQPLNKKPHKKAGLSE